MTLDDCIETLEDMASDKDSWNQLTRQGRGMMFLNLLKWMKELKVYREKAGVGHE